MRASLTDDYLLLDNGLIDALGIFHLVSSIEGESETQVRRDDVRWMSEVPD